MWMSMGVHPGTQGRPQMLGGDTITLQKLESKVFPPLEGCLLFWSPKTPEESDFLETVSARSRCPTFHPHALLSSRAALGQLRYFSMPKVSLQSCPMDPLGYPIPPLLPTTVLPCGPLRTGQVRKPQRGKQRGNRTSPGCGLKDIKTGTQRQIQHGLRPPKPCPAPGPPPPSPPCSLGSPSLPKILLLLGAQPSAPQVGHLPRP